VDEVCIQIFFALGAQPTQICSIFTRDLNCQNYQSY
jgi:hypothetical protein